MLDSINHMTIKLIKNRVFGVKTLRFIGIYYVTLLNFYATIGLSILWHGVIALPGAMLCDQLKEIDYHVNWEYREDLLQNFCTLSLIYFHY